MFRTAELNQKISKADFKAQEPLLRQALLDVQRDLRQVGDFPVIILFAGVDGAGKGETVNLLNEWMDPRWLVTRAYHMSSEEERERPEYWRFWRDLPGSGRIGMFLSSWYSTPILDKVYNNSDLAQFDEHLDRIIAFENALADDGAVIIKFWMHLGKDAQKKRLKSLAKDPLLSWRVTENDWKHWRMYSEFEEAAERTIMRTSTGKAPWKIVEGMDANYRSITVGETILSMLEKKLASVEQQKAADQVEQAASLEVTTEADDERPGATGSAPLTVLDRLDMEQRLTKSSYQAQLRKYQAKLNQLQRHALKEKVSTIMLFEGPDAAGKGGAIRRVIASLDVRNCQVIPIAAPTDEERVHHYLWRFWRHLSRAGRLTIFDRSWYGRVLVERVERFASEDEWRRAYAEVNDFEEQLVQHGIVLLKYWIHISKEEQLARFKAREEIPHKRWKLTDEDWRNRERWDDYAMAVNDMVQHTSTRMAPWVLVEGNDKKFSRIKVLKTLCAQLEETLQKKGDT